MELKDIYELWDRFDRSDVEEMELKMQGDAFHLKKANGSASLQTQPVTESFVTPTRSNTNQAKTEAPLEIESSTASQEAAESPLQEIKAPLVGTFYVAPSPEAEAFIQVGQQIHKGDVIGIIEAMKLMNEVVSDVEGTVTEILAEDGKMVEYDQVLVTLK